VKRAESVQLEHGTEQLAPSFNKPRLVFSRADASGAGNSTSSANTILLVEDDYLIAMQVEVALSEAGFELTGIASSAEEALEVAAAQRPALAIMDIRLAGKRDGVDAALELFRDHGIRCIFATAHSDPDTSKRAEPAQPLGWLQKPYTMASLIEAVQQALDELRGNSDR
jgi:DNA-binding NarL/FixJ family response regulator